MQLVATREDLLGKLLMVTATTERKNTLPILCHVLLEAKAGQLKLRGTDLEVELDTALPATVEQEGTTTVNAKKLLDIVKALPSDAQIKVELDAKERLKIQSGRARFNLASLPANGFPQLTRESGDTRFTVPVPELLELIKTVSHAMGNNDVRYYLNGALFELIDGRLRIVATDGHRLALAEAPNKLDTDAKITNAILPRKAMLELPKVLSGESVEIEASKSYIKFHLADARFTTKLIEGKFPEYERVIPRQNAQIAVIGKAALQQALTRTQILSNEKFRGVRWSFTAGKLEIEAVNTEQERAEETLEIEYTGEDISIGINAGYAMEAIGAVDGGKVRIAMSDSKGPMLFSATDATVFVVMPMNL